ncbi:MAG: alanine--tRNA ligase [Bacilli bacterium]|nr:alanine--tRNA ligase [Bacilli bacterium]
MKKFRSDEIRTMWLDFWRSKGHDIIDSAPLVPINDPTLLWINAGVAPLKKYFDGTSIPKNKRMANAQKSIRTNDIENVGRTARHHTFFEMLGNFSIGDYFREEALTFAMEILTSPRWYGMDINRLYFTVYPNDQDTIQKWMELGVAEDHIIPLADNFWEIGEGPCGPDTEIFFDRGESYDPDHIGVRLLREDISNERYIEIWNIVFSQYNAKAGIPRDQYKELPSKNIDTGMGLERMACVLQEVPTNYETDLFLPIIAKTASITGVDYHGQMAFKVIADHVRSVVFALSDGATFSNEGRGYVLRRLLRRAVRYARILGMNEAILYRLVATVVENMRHFYTYLPSKAEMVTKQIKMEEEKFLMTLASGEKRLLDFIEQANEKIISSQVAFLLYDTFGFPFELTLEVAEEHGFQVDKKGFSSLLQEQKNRARSARSKDQSMNIQNEAMMQFKKASLFVGYDQLLIKAKVTALFQEGRRVQQAKNQVLAVFDQTPFYAESGGQIGDIGFLTVHSQNYTIENTIKLPNGQHASLIDMKDTLLHEEDLVQLAVDETFRQDVARNHSATHLLNEALRQVIGNHVVQQGSMVSNHLLRFDFNHFVPLTNEEILQVEKLVNTEIEKNHPVVVKEMAIEEAKKTGAQALFGEKYNDIVRVIDMDFSKELCGGTHVTQTGEIDKFAILSVETKGSGIYRIEATTKDHIFDELNQSLENIGAEINALLDKKKTLEAVASEENIVLTSPLFELSNPIESYQMVINRRLEWETLRNIVKDMDKEYTKKKREAQVIDLSVLLALKKQIKDYSVLIHRLDDFSVEQLKDTVDRLSNQLANSMVFIGSKQEEKVVFICKNKIPQLSAGALVKIAALHTNGNGGGRNDFAQAGGKDSSKLDEALAIVEKEVTELL